VSRRDANSGIDESLIKVLILIDIPSGFVASCNFALSFLSVLAFFLESHQSFIKPATMMRTTTAAVTMPPMAPPVSLKGWRALSETEPLDSTGGTEAGVAEGKVAGRYGSHRFGMSMSSLLTFLQW
jgi:hypothetical protein